MIRLLKVKTDSRKIIPGDTFVAMEGHTVDGHDFILDAIERGASKIICNRGNYSVETIIVEDTKKWLQNYLVENYAEQVNQLTLIGVTGTNGKTTTCFLTYQLLRLLNIKAAYIGTIGFYCDDMHLDLPNTTPELVDIYQLCLLALEKGCTHLVMEVSSHALEQKRIEGLRYTVEAFTNLTEEHLDYHKDMEHYLQSKLLILKQLKTDGLIMVNIDDPYGKHFLTATHKTLGYQGTDYTILDYETTARGTKIHFAINGKLYEVETNLRSQFNVYNYLTSLAIVHNLGYQVDDILKLTFQLKAPTGRCEIIKAKNGEVIIDYAHTPDAVEKILSTFMDEKKGRIFTIIGCGGDRDTLKRPIMGRIVTTKSDFVIFTSDNPRTEDPNQIMKDILTGVDQDNYMIELNRATAIQKGIAMLEKDDMLFILGKGHETYQIIGHEKQHFSDHEEVLKYIDKSIT